MLEEFKLIWNREYLLGLRQLYKNLHQEKFSSRLRVGDIVLIKNPAKKRQHWKLGKILELIQGSDGNVRAVKIFRGDESYRTNPQIVLHAVKHLYPLEIAITHDHVADISSMDIDLEGVSVIDETEENDMLDESDNLNMGYGYLSDENSVSEGVVEPEQAQINDPVFVPIDEDMATEEQSTSIDRPRRVPSSVKRPMDDQFVLYK